MTLLIQYVKVATGQKKVMELGGNLPESLSKYLMLGYVDTDATEAKENSSKDESDKEEQEQSKS